MKLQSDSKVRKAVIAAGGVGSRLLPFSKAVPKELLPVIETPSIHYVVEEVLEAGMDQIILISGEGKSALENYFKPSPSLERWLASQGKSGLLDRLRKIQTSCEITSVCQEEPLGLGHAILCARDRIGNEPFLVCLGDEIFPPWEEVNRSTAPLKLLRKAFETTGRSTVGVVKIPTEKIPLFGIVDLGGKLPSANPTPIRRTIEKPTVEAAPSSYAILGRYLLTAEVLEILESVSPGFGGEIQLTDAMDRLCETSGLDAVLLNGGHYDMASPLGFIRAQVEAGLRRSDLSQPLRNYLEEVLKRNQK